MKLPRRRIRRRPSAFELVLTHLASIGVAVRRRTLTPGRGVEAQQADL